MKKNICLQSFVDELVQQATEAGMIVNGRKEILFGSILKDPPLFATLNFATTSTPVERVTTFKMLGVHVANDLKWMQCVDAISSKISSRLYFLKQLKRSGAVFVRRSDTPSARIGMPSGIQDQKAGGQKGRGREGLPF